METSSKISGSEQASRSAGQMQLGAVDTIYEQEADATADKIMRMTEPAFIQRKCAHCEEEEKAQRKPLASFIQKKGNDSGTTASETVSQQINASRGNGSSMETPVKSFMESRFGTDFSGVKIHTGSDAVQMSRELHAQAFTVGGDIYFNSGKYNPESSEGKHLLAHELTHTIQQGASTGEAIQRDYAEELPNAEAEFEGFNGEQIDDAIAYNQRQQYVLRDIRVFRDVLGISPEPAVFDEELINALGTYQAQNNLTVDGKMRRGGETARRLARELRAEGNYLGGAEGAALLATRRRLCPNGMKTITVDFVKLSGATRTPATDLAVANRVFRSCCVQFVEGKSVTIDEATTKSWLGGDTDLNLSGITCATPTAEESAMYNGATAAHTLSSTFRIFYPGTTSGYNARAFSRPPYCAGGFVNHAVIYPNALTDTLAHEFGHILLNSGTHSGVDDATDVRNLMFAPGRTASDLDRSQCDTIFNNAT